ncbi:MAG TPA: hypothetical protein VFY91_06570 [Microbacterium sp.]|nr:hypothetical protein [Microbacterium sp.]
MYGSPSTLLSVDAAVVLLRRSHEALQAAASDARVLVADMRWESDAVRHVHERIEGIDRELQTLAWCADDAIGEVLEDQRRRLELLAMWDA